MKGIVMLNRQERDISQQGTRQVPVEKKMKLAQYIRAENMDNRMKIRQREKILYGFQNLVNSFVKKIVGIRTLFRMHLSVLNHGEHFLKHPERIRFLIFFLHDFIEKA